MDVVVRPGQMGDAPQLIRLVRELAEFERLAPPTPEAEARLARDAFGPDARIGVLLAQRGEDVVGYAAVFETYSTFRARLQLHIEDLYVTPSARRSGAATALLRAVARRAVERGCARVTWVVLGWNDGARAFYERHGAAADPSWIPYAIEGDALARLAADQ